MLRSSIKNIQVFEDYLKVTLKNSEQKIRKIAQCVKIKLKTQYFSLPQIFLVVNIDEKNEEFTITIPKVHSWFFEIRESLIREVSIQKILGQGLEREFFFGKKILVVCEAERAFELEELLKNFNSQETFFLYENFNLGKNQKKTTNFLKNSTNNWIIEIENFLSKNKKWDVVLINTNLKILKSLEKILQGESKIIFLTSFLSYSCGSQACYGCILKIQNETKYLRACEYPLLFLNKQGKSFRLKNE